MTERLHYKLEAYSLKDMCYQEGSQKRQYAVDMLKFQVKMSNFSVKLFLSVF